MDGASNAGEGQIVSETKKRAIARFFSINFSWFE
jgi:hypothetical protein